MKRMGLKIRSFAPLFPCFVLLLGNSTKKELFEQEAFDFPSPRLAYSSGHIFICVVFSLPPFFFQDLFNVLPSKIDFLQY